MRELRETGWLRWHMLAAPFGVLATALLLAYLVAPEAWLSRESLRLAGTMADLGAALYAAIALLVELGVKAMFWALQQHRDWRKRVKEEGLQEGLKEGLKEGEKRGERRGERRTQARYRRHLARVARERGIPLEELLPEEPAASE